MPVSATSKFRLTYAGVAIALIFVALFLRLAPISNESVDGDEMFSRRVVMSDPAQAMKMVRRDLVHPPLYYLLLKQTLPADAKSISTPVPSGGPPSALDIRLLSLAAGVALVVIVLLIGFLAPPLMGPAILAATLLALNRTQIFYSQQARSYTVFSLLAGLLLVWSLLLDRYQRHRTYWVAGTALMIALLYTHYFGGFYCAAVILPIVLAKNPMRVKFLALGSGVVAFAAFLPWVFQEVTVYRERAGLSSNLSWENAPTFYDVRRMLFGDTIGVLDFRQGPNLAFLIGAVLMCCALLLPNVRDRERPLDFRIKLTLALTALMPPVLMSLLGWWPLRVPIFGQRHVLPSMAASLILISYGLWRLAARVSKPARAIVIGAIVLAAFQALPVWSYWPGPFREPYAEVAGWLNRNDINLPIYTTWPYGVGQPVSLYLERNRPIDELPADPAKLPGQCIVLYRPAARAESDAVHLLLTRFDISQEKYFSAPKSEWGTRVIVLEARRP